MKTRRVSIAWWSGVLAEAAVLGVGGCAFVGSVPRIAAAVLEGMGPLSAEAPVAVLQALVTCALVGMVGWLGVSAVLKASRAMCAFVALSVLAVLTRREWL